MFISIAAFWQYGLFWTHTAKMSAALHLKELQINRIESFLVTVSYVLSIQ